MDYLIWIYMSVVIIDIVILMETQCIIFDALQCVLCDLAEI